MFDLVADRAVLLELALVIIGVTVHAVGKSYRLKTLQLSTV